MKIKEMRAQLGVTQSEFSRRYNIPLRTIQNWEAGLRKPPEYINKLIENKIQEDLINRKTIILPKYDTHKLNLPKKSDYISAIAWLHAIQNKLGDSVVFALDEALMCQGNFCGRNEEYIIWIYGDDSATQYNGVVILGNHISPHDIREKNGIKFTKFNRTLSDALANEDILDMQGITEAISHYYYSNNKTLDGLSVDSKYQDRFEELINESINYYSY